MRPNLTLKPLSFAVLWDILQRSAAEIPISFPDDEASRTIRNDTRSLDVIAVGSTNLSKRRYLLA